MRDVMAAAAALLPSSPVDAARGGWLTELVRKVTSVWRHSIGAMRARSSSTTTSRTISALWLDPRRVYSCALLPHARPDAGAGWKAKLDHICRKLRLQPTSVSWTSARAGAGCCC